MGRINSSLPKVGGGQAFIVTVQVPHERTQEWCGRALRALERAGFQCGPTSNESIQLIAEQMRLVDGLVQNDDHSTTNGGTDGR